MPLTEAEMAEILRRELIGQEVHGVRILDLELRPSTIWDSDALLVRLTVSDPVADTWTRMQVYALRDRTREAARRTGEDPTRFVAMLEAEHPDYGSDRRSSAA